MSILMKIIIFGLFLLTACSHPYSEMKEGYYVGSEESKIGYVRHYINLQEIHNGKTIERRYEVPDSVYWKINHTHYGTYIKIIER
jgi:hypothetical protein